MFADHQAERKRMARLLAKEEDSSYGTPRHWGRPGIRMPQRERPSTREQMTGTRIEGALVPQSGRPRTARDVRLRASARLYERVARILARAFPAHMAAELHDPIFFIGAGRSGTNLLTDLLRSHPDLSVFPDEANDLWHPRLYPWSDARLDVPPIWADGQAFTRASLDSRSAADDQRLRAAFGAYQRLTRGRYLVNKSIMITFMVEYVLDVFPDARFIHLLRDGRSVALSFAQKDAKNISNTGRATRSTASISRLTSS